VIEKRPAADAFQAMALFSAEHGVLRALQRVLTKSRTPQPVPDLFDEVSAIMETSNQGRTWFVREVRILERRPGIGRSYEALRRASALAAVVGRNPVQEESRQSVALLLRTALDSFARAERPDIVYLKSLYVFARDEGYPVKQQWLPSLSPADRAVAVAALGQPLGEKGPGANDVDRMIRGLEAYLASNAELIFP